MAPLNLKQRFLRAPTLFRAAINDGHPALEAFESDWDQLRLDLERSLSCSSIEPEDLAVVHTVSLQIESLSQSLAKMEQTASSVTESMISDIGDILSNMAITDSSSSPLSYRHVHVPIPSYIKEAFFWLLDNIHDPYPSPHDKLQLSHDVGCSTRMLTEWFKSMRHCIGWTDMCKRHFAGSRRKAREAAYHVFVSCRIDTLSPHIVADFLAVQSRLRSLYPEHSTIIPISSTDRDDVLSPLSPCSMFPRPPSSLSQHSTTPSLIYSTSEESEEDDPLPEISACVRSRLPDSSNLDGQKLTFPTYQTSSSPWPVTSIPAESNFSSVESAFSDSDSSRLATTSSHTTETNNAHLCTPDTSRIAKRKRCLSDVGTEKPRKRPVVALPSRTVSDPLPCSNNVSFDDVEQFISQWLNEDLSCMFEIPAAISAEPDMQNQSWHTIDTIQPPDDNGGMCDPWLPLVAENSSTHISSSESTNITQVASSTPSAEDLWVPLFHIPEPASESEATNAVVNVQPSASVELNSFPSWDCNVSSLDSFGDLLHLPLELSPAMF
ncbi:hypothetical protein C8Q75DRAFT_341558 [Abortiporus biennis]|nr:hypothetical protein C8Q75DRAFT_341558 [Abortiporus biennis]